MIKILSNTKQTLHLLSKGQLKDYYTEADLQAAEKLIHFTTPTKNAANLIEENYIQTETDIYVIKEVNRTNADWVEVFGKLDTDALKATLINTYTSEERLISEVLTDVLAATGWTYTLHDLPTRRRTIRLEEPTYAYNVIMDAMKLYGFEVWFDTVAKIVNIYQTKGSNRGAYVYTDLNMKKLEIQSDTYNFRTRLYAYGKDGLTFADINGGKEYVENFSYSTKILEATWTDERYTVKESLLADAQAKIDILSKPRLSYIVKVVELAKLNPAYSILDFQLGDSVVIIDKDNAKQDTQRIVKLTEYPFTPERNIVELANSKIMLIQSTNNDAIKAAINAVKNEIVVVQTELMAAIDAATERITGETGGNLIIRTNASGKPYELLIMDTDNISTATKVWRWNASGLGFSSSGYNGTYGIAITADGKINASFITTGQLSASLVRTGLLASNDNSSWIDLNTGYFNFKNKVKFDANGFSITLTSGNTVETEIANAKTYAETKATEALNAAKADATTKANAAQAAAIAAANAKAEAERVLAEAYADGIVDSEEAARIAAVNAAATAAANDATAKAAAAEQAAKAYAEAQAADAEANAKGYADSQLSTFANTVNGSLEDLQNQIDGSITTWFYQVPPTTSNAPANTWTTTELKNNHLGDLYYDTITGYAYRWQVVSNTYSWSRITDTDVTKALSDASKAQDTADSKRRVFTTTPTTPYEIGDLWAQGTAGELMRCKTTMLTGNYSATHWEKASKYTDDARAILAESNAKTYAETKATEAQTAAIAAANAKAEAERVLAEAYADGIVSDEEAARITAVNTAAANAAADATAKANAAEAAAKAYASTQATNALNAAKADAEQKAADAEAAAKAYAEAQATAAQVAAEAHADGIVDAEEQARIDAVNAALSSAAADATSKANAAETAAKTYAAAQATAAQNAAKTYTDTEISTVNGVIATKVSTTTYNAGIGSKEDTIYKQSTAPAHAAGRLWLDTTTTPNVLKRSTGSAWVKVTPTTAAEVGAYSSSDGNALAGRITTAESNITQQAGQIASKVEQSTYNTKIGLLESSISTVTQTANSVRLDFDNQVVGGANLLLNSRRNLTNSTYLHSTYDYGNEIPIAGEVYTVSAKFELGSDRTELAVYSSGGQTTLTTLTNADRNADGVASKTFTMVYASGKTPADGFNYLSLYAKPNTGTSGSTVEWVKLEKGNVATDWTQAPQELVSGTTRIDANGITVGLEDSTLESNLSNEGVKVYDTTNPDEPIALFGSSGSLIPTLETYSVTGDIINTLPNSLTFNIGSGKDYATVSAALATLNANKKLTKFLSNHTIEFNIYGTISDNIVVNNFIGGTMNFNFQSGSKLVGSFYFAYNTTRITISGPSSSNYAIIQRSSGDYLIDSFTNSYIEVRYMNLDGMNYATARGMRFYSGSTAYVINCDFSRMEHAIMSYYGSQVFAVGNRGNVTGYGYNIISAALYARSNCPTGATGNVSRGSGHYFTTGTITAAPTQYVYSAPGAQTYIETFYPSSMLTYLHGTTTKATYYGNTAAQGKYSGMSNSMDGVIKFGTDAYNFTVGGTITKIELSVYRANTSHGPSAGVQPMPDDFTATPAFNAIGRGVWSDWVVVPNAELTSTGASFKFYHPTLNSGYAIFSNAKLRITVSKTV